MLPRALLPLNIALGIARCRVSGDIARPAYNFKWTTAGRVERLGRARSRVTYSPAEDIAEEAKARRCSMFPRGK